MAKLSQLLTLERMLDAYDNLNINDAWIIEKQGECVEELVDAIIAKLNRLLSSKTRLSCRNVLVANFETMKNTEHWLKRKLFADLPKDLSKVLRDKIDQMVDSLKALMLKIIDVKADFADEFFERMKKRCRKYSTTDYDLWKAQQSQITIQSLVTHQVDLTADMLECGILKYAGRPNGEEIQDVDKDKLALKLTDKSRLTDDFIRECAKLRRYSHWEGDRFVIDYHLLRKYLFCEFGKLTCEQHIMMYEYDIQMKQIHEDIRRLNEEEMRAEGEMNTEEGMKEARIGLKEAVKRAVNKMWAEGELQHKYDHTWIMMTMNETEGLQSFATPTEYLDYMEGCGVMDRLPDRSMVSKYYDRAHGTFPNWTFTDAKDKEEKRRNNVGKRFLNLVQRA